MLRDCRVAGLSASLRQGVCGVVWCGVVWCGVCACSIATVSYLKSLGITEFTQASGNIDECNGFRFFIDNRFFTKNFALQAT